MSVLQELRNLVDDKTNKMFSGVIRLVLVSDLHVIFVGEWTAQEKQLSRSMGPFDSKSYRMPQ